MPVRFDAQAAARLERMYAAPEIVEQRARTRAALRARPGERGLDVGCGPGFLACELARDVGPAGRVTAIDASPEMLEAARARVAREGLADRVELAPGDAARSTSRAAPSTSSSPCRSISTFPASRKPWPRPLAFFARVAGWWSWTPTGTRACG